MARIVVGIDDSPAATAALRWALEEARLRQATLEIVHTWVFPAVGELPGGTVDTLVADLERGATAVMDEVVDEVVGAEPGVNVVRRVLEGSAGRILIETAVGADLLVVGSRGRGGFAGLLLGSVAQQCIHHARCPVVVVREEKHP